MPLCETPRRKRCLCNVLAENVKSQPNPQETTGATEVLSGKCRKVITVLWLIPVLGKYTHEQGYLGTIRMILVHQCFLIFVFIKGNALKSVAC